MMHDAMRSAGLRVMLMGLGVAALLAISAATARAEDAPPPTTKPESGGTRVPFRAEVVLNALHQAINTVNLTDEQKKKVDDLFAKAIEELKAVEADAAQQPTDKLRKFSERFKQLQQDVVDALDGEQKELVQKMIAGRMNNGGATSRPFGPPQVIKRLDQFIGQLDLTDEQRAKITKASEDLKTIVSEAVAAARDGGFTDELRSKILGASMEYRRIVMDVLTDEQKTKLRELMYSRSDAPGATSAPGGAGTSAPPNPATQPAK